MAVGVPQALLQALQESAVYTLWKKKHPTAFLSHLFCSIAADGSPKSGWDIGFYLPETEKMAVFSQGYPEVAGEDVSFILKPEDDVFKETAAVEELSFSASMLSFPNAVKRWAEELPKAFPREQAGNGFVILQKFQGKTVWNFTVLSPSFTLLNVKLNASDGILVNAAPVNLVVQTP
ncbi:MAG: hypothetical protein Q8R53_01620 [Nanoarchaeota archaeon]|nr:hypothetical protein [Nanoarchaeota archaeon]